MKIEQIKEKFKIDTGAPMPTLLSNEHHVYLTFYVRHIDPNWDGKSVHVRSKKDSGIVTVQFHQFAQFKFGNPNDEAIEGHPYYTHGLQPYAMQIVQDSNWIKQLCQMNSVHYNHKDEYFSNYKHYIFFFHDTCFEIVATGYTIEENCLSNMKEEIKRISALL